MEQMRKHIIFYGRVQGVGFRYASVHKARALGLTGYVCNLFDGTVEMEVQGDETMIDELIGFLLNHRYIRIENMSVKSIELMDERDFKSD